MQKIKQFIQSDKGKDIMTVLVIILVALSSFYLGRLSKKSQKEGIQIEYIKQEANVLSSQNNNTNLNNLNIKNQINSSFYQDSTNSIIENKPYFASNRGQKYYSIYCSAGKTIKQENRIYFDTKEQAEASGYELSSSCK